MNTAASPPHPPRLQPRVQSRLLRVFVLQLALISLVTIIGVLVASYVAERLLVNKALTGEANYYWAERAKDPLFALPNTLNLQAYLSSNANLPPPAVMANLAIGQHRIDIDGDDRIVYVSEKNGERLYLLFQDETVSNLAFYFGVAPLTLVLLIMYGLAFLAYWLSNRAVSPIARLADTIEHFDFNARDASEWDIGLLSGPQSSETMVLAEALDHFVQRSKASIERERNFTRFASHELRTPLAVIQGSVSSLELANLEGAPGRALDRIGRSVRQMSEFIGTLLVLARSPNDRDTFEEINVNRLVKEIAEEIQVLHPNKPVELIIDEPASLNVEAPAAVVSMVLGNLLRNAFSYTELGEVRVVVREGSVVVKDTGQGISSVAQERVFDPFFRADTTAGGPQGQGLGLAIVKQSCDNYGWQVSINSEAGKGATFTVIFHE